ncbi:tRNA(Ile2) C34 agmatinyltransferase TiaS [Paenibacillus shirakamiensis]|uniref:tRNA(Ile2) C34 agmatinyltransferase TiaS n=1 Tax=Paenibacillus shirakamiensis TaxID=1265935 RepID=A0ABS4JI35_9BACL|nr:hypothetical protein [Paenibacillus shirakamiensis]MBP2001362.1 tRNA(Ile2) C34 agmatinyltransferase TiaS [Paenibacillus shirakamiensis]
MKKLLVTSILGTLMACTMVTVPQVDARSHQTYAEPVTAIPMLTSLRQIAPNQLQVTYDQPVDQVKGIDPKNYWIQSTSEQTPTNIATLGMNDSVNSTNSLTAANVSIQTTGSKGQSFILTFKQNISKGMAFKMIICFVTKPGAPLYTGDNGSAAFVGE